MIKNFTSNNNKLYFTDKVSFSPKRRLYVSFSSRYLFESFRSLHSTTRFLVSTSPSSIPFNNKESYLNFVYADIENLLNSNPHDSNLQHKIETFLFKSTITYNDNINIKSITSDINFSSDSSQWILQKHAHILR